MLRISKNLLAVLPTFIALASPALADAPLPPRPKLIVVIAIDQFRADYLTRSKKGFCRPRARTTASEVTDT